MVDNSSTTAPRGGDVVSSKQLIATACIAVGISIAGGLTYYLLTRAPAETKRPRRAKKPAKATALVDTDTDEEATETPRLH